MLWIITRRTALRWLDLRWGEWIDLSSGHRALFKGIMFAFLDCRAFVAGDFACCGDMLPAPAAKLYAGESGSHWDCELRLPTYHYFFRSLATFRNCWFPNSCLMVCQLAKQRLWYSKQRVGYILGARVSGWGRVMWNFI